MNFLAWVGVWFAIGLLVMFFYQRAVARMEDAGMEPDLKSEPDIFVQILVWPITLMLAVAILGRFPKIKK